MLLKGWIKLILGWLLVVLAGLVAVGSLASGRVASLLMTLPLLACAVALVISGKRGLATAATQVRQVQQVEPAWQYDEGCQCPSCGAFDLPDSEGGCQYCGSRM